MKSDTKHDAQTRRQVRLSTMRPWGMLVGVGLKKNIDQMWQYTGSQTGQTNKVTTQHHKNLMV
jgi:hypothetical protein